jgi:hypothetical protein
MIALELWISSLTVDFQYVLKPPQGIVVNMGVTLGCAGTYVAKQFADDW